MYSSVTNASGFLFLCAVGLGWRIFSDTFFVLPFQVWVSINYKCEDFPWQGTSQSATTHNNKTWPTQIHIFYHPSHALREDLWSQSLRWLENYLRNTISNSIHFCTFRPAGLSMLFNRSTGYQGQEVYTSCVNPPKRKQVSDGPTNIQYTVVAYRVMKHKNWTAWLQRSKTFCLSIQFQVCLLSLDRCVPSILQLKDDKIFSVRQAQRICL